MAFTATLTRITLLSLFLLVASACPAPSAPPPTPTPTATPSSVVHPGAGKTGATCVMESDCESGRCEGFAPGCDAKGTCRDFDTPCTADMASFCGCDGETFHGSSSCVGRRAHNGACKP